MDFEKGYLRQAERAGLYLVSGWAELAWAVVVVGVALALVIEEVIPSFWLAIAVPLGPILSTHAIWRIDKTHRE